GQLQQRARDTREIEELALAIGAEEMMHRHLDDLEATLFDARHHLNSDTAAIAFQRKALQDVASKQPKVAVDVAEVQAKPPAHKVVVCAANDLAVQRIVALELPALDDIHVGSEAGIQLGQLGRIVLSVAVGVENQVLGGQREHAA